MQVLEQRLTKVIAQEEVMLICEEITIKHVASPLLSRACVVALVSNCVSQSVEIDVTEKSRY